jgi:hypothetical protein
LSHEQKDCIQRRYPPRISTFRSGIVGNIIKFEREALYAEVWTNPVTTLCKRYELSDVGLRKICLKLGVPLPPRGHWARIHAGHKIERPPLPPHDGMHSCVARVDRHSAQVVADEATISALQQIEVDGKDPTKNVTILIGGELRHPAVKKLVTRLKFIDRDIADGRKPPSRGERIRFRSRFDREPGGVIKPDNGVLAVIVTPALRDRALAIADALFTALSAHGFSVSFKESRTVLACQDVSASIRIVELTKKEGPAYDDPWNAIGRLRIKIQRETYDVPLPNAITVQDDPGRPLEGKLNSLVARLRRAVVGFEARNELRRQKKRREDDERERREQRSRQMALDAEAARREELRVEDLLTESDEWLMVGNRLRYLDHLEAAVHSRGGSTEPGSAAGEWIKWARAALEKMDPTNWRMDLLVRNESPTLPEN